MQREDHSLTKVIGEIEKILLMIWSKEWFDWTVIIYTLINKSIIIKFFVMNKYRGKYDDSYKVIKTEGN